MKFKEEREVWKLGKYHDQVALDSSCRGELLLQGPKTEVRRLKEEKMEGKRVNTSISSLDL